MSKKIIYFAVLLEGSKTGIAKKVDAQAAIWNRMGHEVEIVVLTREKFFLDWNEKAHYKVHLEGKGVCKFIKRYRLFRSVMDRKPDIIYLRDGFPFIFPRKKFQTQIILEVQSKLQSELFARSFFLGALSILLDFLYLRKVDKFIFLSAEISQSIRFRKYIIPGNFKVISNGVDLERKTTLEFSTEFQELELIFLGQDGQFWNGIEQMIELARSLPEFRFHIIGPSQPINLQLPNLLFYGFLTEEEYLPIARKCCVAIGTLNLRAKRMKEGSSLKLREYLALGLPAIIRYSDSDFIEPRDFILQIPDNDEPITQFSKAIEAFTRKWYGRRVPRDLIAHIDINVKERERLSFML